MNSNFNKAVSILIIILMLFTPFTVFGQVTSSSDENNLHVENTYVRVTVNKENGRFSIKTTSGSPNRDSDTDKKLLFMELTPETSFTTFRIDGQDFIYGNEYNHDDITSEFIETPKFYGNTNYSKWRIGNIYISQYLIIENDGEDTGDVKIKYEVENRNPYRMRSKKIGARILLDTNLGENDGAFIGVSSIDTPIVTERQFSDESMPHFWYGLDSLDSPDVVSKGTLLTGRYKNPTSLIIAHWNGLSSTKWDYSVDNNLNITKDDNKYGSADSAVAVYFEPEWVSGGSETVFMTSYGIGDVTVQKNNNGFVAGIASSVKMLDVVNVDGEVSYTPNPIEIIAYLDNTYKDSQILNNVTFDISSFLNSYSHVFEIEEGENPIVTFDTIERNTMVQVSYKLKVKDRALTEEFHPFINIKLDNEVVDTLSTSIIVPELTNDMNIMFLESTPKDIYANSVDKKIFIMGEGFAYINEDVDLAINLKNENGTTPLSKNDIRILSDRDIKVILPEDIEVGQYSIEIVKDSVVHTTFENGLKITNDDRFASRVYSELALGDLFTIKGNLNESNGVYTTLPETTYIINSFVKFKGNMSIDTTKPLTDDNCIKGNGTFYVDFNTFVRSPRNVFYVGDFSLFQGKDDDEELEDSLTLYVKSEFSSPLFCDVGLNWPVAANEIKFDSDNVQISGDIGVKFMGLDIEDTVTFTGFAIENVLLNENGVNYKGYVEIDKPFSVGPLETTWLKLSIDTENDGWGIFGTVPLPDKLDNVELSLGLGFVNWTTLNSVELQGNGLEYPLKTFPLTLSGIVGSVNNIADREEMPLTVNLLCHLHDTSSPEIMGYYMYNFLNAGVIISNKHLVVRGDNYFYFLPNGSKELVVVWDKDGLKDYDFEGVGLKADLRPYPMLTTKGNLVIETNGDVKGSFTGRVEVPKEVPLIGGKGFDFSKATYKDNVITAMLDAEIMKVKMSYDIGKGSIKFNTSPDFLQVFADIADFASDSGKFLYKNGILEPIGVVPDCVKDVALDIYNVGADAFGTVSKKVKSFFKKLFGWGSYNDTYFEGPMYAFLGESLLDPLPVAGYTVELKCNQDSSSEENVLGFTSSDERLLITTDTKVKDSLVVYKHDGSTYELNDDNTITDVNGNISFVIDNPEETGYFIVYPSEFTADLSAIKYTPEFSDINATIHDNELQIDYTFAGNLPDTLTKLVLVDDTQKIEGIEIVKDLTDTTYTFTLPDDLQSGDYYVYAYAEREGSGFDYIYSDSFIYTNSNTPSIVENFSATYSGNEKVNFSWNSMEGIDKYYIYYTNESDETNYIEIENTESSLISTDLTAGNYTIGIYAVKTNSDTEFIGETNEISFTMPQSNPPVVDINFSTDGNMIEKNTTLNGESIVQYFVDEHNLTISGTSNTNVDIEVYINDDGDASPTYTINNTSDFTQAISITEDGDYNIRVVAIADNGDKSQYYYDFEVDTVAPYLEVTSPINGDKVSDTFILVSGQSEPSCQLKVNNMTVDMDDEGYFSFSMLPSYTLSNVVTVTVVDYAGNKTEYEAQLANETHEITGFEVLSEETTMYENETQLIYGAVIDVLGNRQMLSSENVHFEIIDGNGVIDSAGILTPLGAGTITIKGAFISSKEVMMEDEMTITVLNRPSTQTDNSNTQFETEINKIYSKKIDFEEVGTLEFPERAVIEFPIGSLTEDTIIEMRIVDTNNESVKLPDSNKMNLVGNVLEINTSGNRRFEKPVKIIFYLSSTIDNKENYGVYYYNEQLEQWLYIGSRVENNEIVAEVGHLTKFAVFYNDNLKSMIDIENNWAENYIRTLVGREVINGVPNLDGTYSFKPDNLITRAEFCALAVRMYGFDTDVDYNVNFGDYEDIPTWAMPFMQSAFSNGMLEGVQIEGNTYLKPNDYITRQEIVTILGRIYDYTPTSEASFTDNSMIAPWAKKYVDQMVQLRVVNGRPNNKFAPEDFATRAECAAIIFRLIDIMESDVDSNY